MVEKSARVERALLRGAWQKLVRMEPTNYDASEDARTMPWCFWQTVVGLRVRSCVTALRVSNRSRKQKVTPSKWIQDIDLRLVTCALVKGRQGQSRFRSATHSRGKLEYTAQHFPPRGSGYRLRGAIFYV